MRVLGFVPESERTKIIGSHYYRIYLPLREVNKHNDDIDANITGEDTMRNLVLVYKQALTDGDDERAAEIFEMLDRETNNRDIYIRSRLHLDPEVAKETVNKIHDNGGLLILDADDDLTEDFKLVTARGEQFKQCLYLADHVTVTTQALANHLSQYTQRPPTVLKNHVDVEWMQEIAAKGKRVPPGFTVGFSGSPTHWGDWYIPSVSLSRATRDLDITPVLHGEVPRYLKFVALEEDYFQFGGVPFQQYPILLSQFDVILCAVDSKDEFNSGKSAVKALECMSIGVVPVCSRFIPYMELAEAGAPVIIVQEDTRDGWYEAIRDISNNRDKHTRLRQRGPEWVKANRDMCVNGYKQWETLFREITSSSGKV